MQSISALELRQSLSKVMARLKRTGKPILLRRGKEPVAVIISLEDFRERFSEQQAEAERRQLLIEMDALARVSKQKASGVEVLRELRDDQ